jgi:energy-coupling factor transporter ATP-binding protein EcfA2
MRISRWFVPKKRTEKEGLEPIFLERLGVVVALIGKNGSGKSRILKMLEDSESWMEDFMIKDFSFSNYANNDEENISKINIFDYELTDYIKYYNQELLSFNNPNIKSNIQKYIDSLIKKNERKKNLFKALFSDEKKEKTNIMQKPYEPYGRNIKYFIKDKIKRISYPDIHELKEALSKKELEQDKDNSDMRPSRVDLSKFGNLLTGVSFKDEVNEIKILNELGRTFFETLKHELVRDFHLSVGVQNDYEQKESYKQYSILKKFIKDFMNKELTVKKVQVNDIADIDGVTTSSKGEWELDGLTFNYNALSDGEKTLFAYSILFFILEKNSSIPIRNSIIIIDEPELHLHPGSEVAVINGIRKVIEGGGQLWIATHSLSILASLDTNEIFLVKDNTISTPSRLTPGRTLEELMDSSGTLEKLSHFVSNQSSWSYINFLDQCFSDPEVFFSAELGDPQVEVFIKAIEKHPDGAVLLDFGAGKGRLYKEMQEESILDIEYYGLEPDSENREKLIELGVKNLYSDYKELESSKFHFICLCNVLHEINIQTWEQNLNKIISSMKSDGQIIIIEDMMMPKGEWISGAGYLVLDIESIKDLFGLETLPLNISASKIGMSGRILCTSIQKKNIKKVTNSSIIQALQKRKSNVWSELLEIRPLNDNAQSFSSNNDVKMGREYAFLSQLYLNCLRAIQILEQN